MPARLTFPSVSGSTSGEPRHWLNNVLYIFTKKDIFLPVSDPIYECRILALREKLRFSQVELARRAGLTRQAVNMIERGLSVPSIVTAFRLAEVLGCSVADLFKMPEKEETVPVIFSSAALRVCGA